MGDGISEMSEDLIDLSSNWVLENQMIPSMLFRLENSGFLVRNKSLHLNLSKNSDNRWMNVHPNQRFRSPHFGMGRNLGSFHILHELWQKATCKYKGYRAIIVPGTLSSEGE